MFFFRGSQKQPLFFNFPSWLPFLDISLQLKSFARDSRTFQIIWNTRIFCPNFQLLNFQFRKFLVLTIYAEISVFFRVYLELFLKRGGQRLGEETSAQVQVVFLWCLTLPPPHSTLFSSSGTSDLCFQCCCRSFCCMEGAPGVVTKIFYSLISLVIVLLTTEVECQRND